MVYIKVFYVDGGCRNNGQPGAFAAAAAVEMLRGGQTITHSRRLPNETWGKPRPTNQRAEITAMIVALETALERYSQLSTSPKMRLRIFSDSRYAVTCMNDWIYKWSGNGWVNAKGSTVVNKELIQEASRLDDEVRRLGTVRYEWVPRSQNQGADRACNEELDEMVKEEKIRYYPSSSDDDW